MIRLRRKSKEAIQHSKNHLVNLQQSIFPKTSKIMDIVQSKSIEVMKTKTSVICWSLIWWYQFFYFTSSYIVLHRLQQYVGMISVMHDQALQWNERSYWPDVFYHRSIGPQVGIHCWPTKVTPSPTYPHSFQHPLLPVPQESNIIDSLITS